MLPSQQPFPPQQTTPTMVSSHLHHTSSTEKRTNSHLARHNATLPTKLPGQPHTSAPGVPIVPFAPKPMTAAASPRPYYMMPQPRREKFASFGHGLVAAFRPLLKPGKVEPLAQGTANVGNRDEFKFASPRVLAPQASPTALPLTSSAAQQRPNTSSKVVICSICNAHMSSLEELRHHTKEHVGAKSFTCPECGKVVSRKDNVSDRVCVCVCVQCDANSSSLCSSSHIFEFIRVKDRSRVQSVEKSFHSGAHSRIIIERIQMTNLSNVHSASKVVSNRCVYMCQLNPVAQCVCVSQSNGGVV